MRATSQRAMQAALARVRAAAAPEVTMPACAPVALAMTRLAAACSSAMSTDAPAASTMACSTSGSIRLPPRRVSVPAALMRRGTPRVA